MPVLLPNADRKRKCRHDGRGDNGSSDAFMWLRGCSLLSGKTRREKAAKKRVDELFGDAASGFNQDEDVLNFMKQGIDLINDGKIRNLTLNLNKGLKCKIAVMTDDKIKVSREVKSVVEFKQ